MFSFGSIHVFDFINFEEIECYNWAFYRKIILTINFVNVEVYEIKYEDE